MFTKLTLFLITFIGIAESLPSVTFVSNVDSGAYTRVYGNGEHFEVRRIGHVSNECTKENNENAVFYLNKEKKIEYGKLRNDNTIIRNQKSLKSLKNT